MSLAFQIQLRRDTASPAVQRLGEGLKPAVLNPLFGQTATNTVKRHLVGLQQSRPNAMGGPRTNFYASAAKGTQFRVEGDNVVVSINKVGIGLRYFGGTVRPKVKKFLTIPARAEAHGKRASEFNDLEVLVGRNGPYALARRVSTLISLRKSRTSGAITVGNRGVRGGEIMFWLVKEVRHTADPTVLPSADVTQEAIQDTFAKHVKLLTERSAQ